MGDIFREIDEELRQERAQKLWRAYGRYVIAAAVVFVLAVAGYKGWEQYQTGQRLEAGAKFAAAKALVEQDRPEEAAALFAALARETNTTYGTLARFHEAALKASSGDSAGAVAALRALSRDRALDRPTRELATILAALNAPATPGPEILADLAPLAEEGSPWRYTALEILGLVARSEGRHEDARKYLQQIVDDIDAPTNIRARATQMLAMMAEP